MSEMKKMILILILVLSYPVFQCCGQTLLINSVPKGWEKEKTVVRGVEVAVFNNKPEYIDIKIANQSISNVELNQSSLETFKSGLEKSGISGPHPARQLRKMGLKKQIPINN